MVQYKCDGIFDAPLNKIWELLNNSYAHVHKSIKRRRVLGMQGALITIEVEIDDPDRKDTHFETWKMLMKAPKGYEMEIVGGPMDGSKLTHSYTPMGGQTKVEVAGEINVKGMNDEEALKLADTFFGELFEEDNASLKSL